MKKIFFAALAAIGLVVLMSAQTKPTQTKPGQTKARKQYCHCKTNRCFETTPGRMVKKCTTPTALPVIRLMVVVYQDLIRRYRKQNMYWAIKTRLITIVLKGMSEEVEIDGEVYDNNMSAHNFLTDQQVADVLTYVRNSFTNKASAVTPAEVKTVRSKTK